MLYASLVIVSMLLFLIIKPKMFKGFISIFLLRMILIVPILYFVVLTLSTIGISIRISMLGLLVVGLFGGLGALFYIVVSLFYYFF